MKIFFYYLLLITVALCTVNAQSNYDQKIKQVHSKMSVDSVRGFITDMQNFGSRFEYNENRFAIANWLKNEFLTMGFTNVELDSFMCETSWDGNPPALQINVIATLTGAKQPDDIYIIGGHYDSFNQTVDPLTYAPGADDNASGTTAVLETARAIMESGYQPDATIKFVCFAAEELMLFGYSGSEHLSDRYRAEGKNIKLMINNDMISHNQAPLEESIVSINYYPGYEHLLDQTIELTNTYTLIQAETGNTDQWSDSKPFFNQGYPAVYFEEFDFSPYYHTSDDIIANYNMDYCFEVIKASSAMLIYSCETPGTVTNFIAADYGDGNSVLLKWNTYPNDFKNYNIYIGTEQNSLTLFATSTDSLYLITGLNEKTKYYLGIRIVDNDGDEGWIITASCTPNNLPLPPAEITIEPKWQSVELKWTANTEFDFAGYNIYRSTEGLNDEIKLNQELLTTTTFTDNNLQSGTFYDYFLSAVDEDGNEGNKTDAFRSRAVSLDQGILFVDESKAGDGSIGNPTFEQLDDFYLSLLYDDIKFDNYNVSINTDIDLSIIGAYNTIFWHLDSKSSSNALNVISDLRDYLNYGGNILFTGFRPCVSFSEYAIPGEGFFNGTFIFDFMKIDSMNYNFMARLNSAANNFAGYPLMEVDPEKTKPSLNNHLTQIESISANNIGNQIYLWGSDYDVSTPQGSFNGNPIGVEYLGTDHKSVVLSVPLYYFKKDQAKTFLNYVLKERFNVPTEIDENEESIVNEFSLLQNYPNPFNPTTVISFQLSVYSKTQLKIYDVLGREVAELMDEYKNPGCYQVEFNASNLSSGIYFYKLQAGEYSAVRKMMLIK